MARQTMHQTIFEGALIDDAALTLDELARAIAVERDWIVAHVQEGLLSCMVVVEISHATVDQTSRETGHKISRESEKESSEESMGHWRFASREMLRARRLAAIERDFDANPEIAALLVDLEDELAALRQRLSR